MKRMFEKIKGFFLKVFDRIKRHLSRISPSSVWTRLGIARFVSAKALVYWLIALLVAGMIIFFCAQNGTDSSTMSKGLLDFIAKIVPFVESTSDAEFFLRKAGHFTIFALESLFLSAAMINTFNKKRGAKRSILMISLLLAILSECLQLLAKDRGPRVWDVVIDFSGAVTGLIVYCIYYSIYF